MLYMTCIDRLHASIASAVGCVAHQAPPCELGTMCVSLAGCQVIQDNLHQQDAAVLCSQKWG